MVEKVNKIELLAPAGDLRRAKIALLYGADAVYVGGSNFSLRARASNFTMDDIKELCTFAHGLNKLVYVTMNILPHDSDLDNLDKYLLDIGSYSVDAIISSSYTILKRAEELIPSVERHISTQLSVLNNSSLEFYKSVVNCSRIVLAREASLDEIQKISNHSSIDLEVFIHGGMCSSYSGRCMLSNHLTTRDANRGGCAHSCRWNYYLYNGKKRLFKHPFFNMGSKDLMALEAIPRLIDMGICSLKIEGRMKSSYYLACVISCYRKFIDEYYLNPLEATSHMKVYEERIAKTENRLTSTGFLFGEATPLLQLYDSDNSHPNQSYIADVLKQDIDTKKATLLVRNYFKVGDWVEIFGPNKTSKAFQINSIIDVKTKLPLLVCNCPLVEVEVDLSEIVEPYSMVRVLNR